MVIRLHDVGYRVFLGSAWKEGGDGSEIRQREKLSYYSIPTQVFSHGAERILRILLSWEERIFVVPYQPIPG